MQPPATQILRPPVTENPAVGSFVLHAEIRRAQREAAQFGCSKARKQEKVFEQDRQYRFPSGRARLKCSR